MIGLQAVPTTTTAPISIPTLLLSGMVWLPSIGATALLFFPARTEAHWARIRSFVQAVVAVVLGLGVLMWYGFRDQTGTYAYEETRGWLAGLNSSYHLGVDGVSMPMLLLSSVLFVFAVLASSRVREQTREYFILLLVLETGVNGVFASLDYLLFFLFWQLQAVPMFLLVARFGGVRRLAAAWRLLAVEAVSGGLLLLAILILYFSGKTHTFDIAALHDVAVPAASGLLITWLFFIAFALKLPVFPFHTWFIDAQSEASPPIALLLGGVGVKLAGYGLIRVNAGEFQHATHRIMGLMVVVAVITVLWSALAALGQDHLRRLVGYVVVAHMGLVLLAAASGSTIAINGAVLMMVADGLSVALLVLVAAAVIERANTTSLRAMGGMATRMSRGAIVAMLAALAAAGFPGVLGFLGQLLILVGSYGSHRIATPLILLGLLVLTAAMVWMVQRIFFGVLPEAQARIRDLGTLELGSTVGLFSLLVLLGILPGLLMDVINFSVTTLLTSSGG
jgi:proton-translocating NADH-quinone oxidoreductase chain M